MDEYKACKATGAAQGAHHPMALQGLAKAVLPALLGVLQVQRWVVFDKTQALFVGSSSMDAAMARQSGVAVWWLPYGYNMGEPVSHGQPDRIIVKLFHPT